MDIGHRHILPTYGPVFVLAGAAAAWFTSRWKPARVLPVLLVVAMAAESLMVRPDYLAYFNQLAGGPSQGYKHLVDSSLDWGQDLPALKQHLDHLAAASGPETPVYLSYFGSASPDYYGLHLQDTFHNRFTII